MALSGRYPRQQIAEGCHDVLPSSPGAERFVREADIGDGWLHPDASNYTFVVELGLGECAGYGVYKPKAGEAPLWDFPHGTLHLRECAAYELSKALGWGLTPPTALRVGEAGEGSLQLFVAHDPDSNFFTFRDSREEEALRIAVFDVIANNADRKGGHCFVGPDDRVWAVDNGLTFNTDDKLRTVIWDFAGRPIPDHLLEDMQRVARSLDAGESTSDAGSSGFDAGESSFAGVLRGLLSPAEMDMLRERVRRLLESPVLPHPRSRRDLPWPWL